MSPFQEKLFKKEYAHQLLLIAQSDLRCAKILAESKEERKVNTLYLAQQSLEKAIKAVLCWNGLPIPLSHDIGILLTKLPDSIQCPINPELNDLTQYATIKRYLEGFEIDTNEEVVHIIHEVESAIEWCQLKIK